MESAFTKSATSEGNRGQKEKAIDPLAYLDGGYWDFF